VVRQLFIPPQMSFLLRSLLHILHSLYRIFTLLASHKSHPQPYELTYPRKQIPHHLALLLVSGDGPASGDAVLDCFLESIQRTVEWCRTVGIGKLTVYDRDGLLSANIEQVSQCLPIPTQRYSEDETSETEYPLTPPPSDVSDSRPLSPVNLRSLNLDVTTFEVHSTIPVEDENTRGPKQRRKNRPNPEKSTDEITIRVISRSSGKPAVAHAAHIMANDPKWKQQRIGVQDLNATLEGDRGFPSPDFTILHNIFPSLRRRKQPLELYGFPPWQITLTEFHDCSEYSPISLPWVGAPSRDPEPLSEVNFRRGLDEFAGAQMRFGK
jgi:dehydrodolichyl diphosphate syntase complex subunit NUS1